MIYDNLRVDLRSSVLVPWLPECKIALHVLRDMRIGENCNIV